MYDTMTSAEFRAYQWRAMTEKQFSQQIVNMARMLGWLCWRTWTSKHSPAGEPDLRLVRPPRVIYAELKTMKGKLSPAQTEALALLRQCPQLEVYMWRPSDIDEIERILE